MTEGFCRVRWRPGCEPDGGDELVSLRGLLVHAEDIAEAQAPHPPALSSLLRLLYVLTARITGLDQLDGADDWEERRADLLKSDGGFDVGAIDDYFAKYPGRFELFHTSSDVPFLQDARLLEQCVTTKGEPTSSGVNKLVLGRAAGQSFVWQSHTTDRDPVAVSAPDAVFALLTWLYYGAPGRCTPRRVDQVHEANTKAGPLRGTVSFHPLGESLYETLVLGVPYLPTSDVDMAPWEEEPGNPLAPPPRPAGVAGVLIRRFQHAVLLSPAPEGASVVDARITWAWRQPQAAVTDPYLFHRTKSETDKVFPKPADAGRAVWRDLDGLLGHGGPWRPKVFDDLDFVMHDRQRGVRIKALGFDQDRSQDKDRQFFSATTPALLEQWETMQDRDPEPWSRLRRCLNQAETSGDLLGQALTQAWRELGRTHDDKRTRDGGVRWHYAGMTRYWSEAENEFWSIVRASQPPEDSVTNRFIFCAVGAYDRVTEGFVRSPEDVKVVAKHRVRLWRGWQRKNQGDQDD